jgi:hypothetical protein
VRDEFFGDARDYFKYSFLDYMASQLPAIQRLTFLPMMRPDQGRGDGNVRLRRVDGFERIADFLENRLRERVRSVSELTQLFAHTPYEFNLYALGVIFGPSNRTAYVQDVPLTWLRRGLVFLDPDNGLVPRSVRSKPRIGGEYVTTDDLKTILKASGSSSVVVVYQHRPRYRPATQYYGEIAEELLTGLQVAGVEVVSTGPVGLFAFGLDASGMRALSLTATEFASRWPGAKAKSYVNSEPMTALIE